MPEPIYTKDYISLQISMENFLSFKIKLQRHDKLKSRDHLYSDRLDIGRQAWNSHFQCCITPGKPMELHMGILVHTLKHKKLKQREGIKLSKKPVKSGNQQQGSSVMTRDGVRTSSWMVSK